ncbi:hypothetical protein [Thomasclavelia cocleata]|uniref:hypothetical protein n=1 Tax=Thomasclavelia cocleata TaxID=69824 RepID=UPI00242D4211|nr:hypothetical protein [Thomasclavelia cocleata]
MYIKSGIFTEIIEFEDYVLINDYFYGKQYIINETIKLEIIKKALNEISFEKLIEEYGEDATKLINEMINAKVIMFTKNKKVYKDEITNGGILSRYYSSNSKRLPIKKICIEISSKCKNNCRSCGTDTLFKCQSCYKTDETSGDFVANLLNFIKNVSTDSLYEILFIGADPLNNIDYIKMIINDIKLFNPNIRFSIVSSLSNYSNKTFNFINDNQIHIYYQSVYSIKKSIKIINELLDKNISFSVVMRLSNQEELINYCVINKLPYIINYYIENISDNDSYITNLNKVMGLPNFDQKINCKVSSNCLFGNILISINGDISLCKKYKKIANIYNSNIDYNHLLENITNEWRDHTKESEKCINCKIKYLCRSCTALNKEYLSNNCTLYNAKIY